ncbi:S8 family serine peptidase [Paenibacillus oryzisoli]|uniref:Fibronectin type-III domain-containing protein n=1 Tax=Paenibacillus oryzisoli TaxID=1850517 RepID=A0A198A0Z8_9BACL|nr:S8 family serine peptidase [Paenibacillus oryzisoli]OAS14691.1 hypothetical protein A8708_23605 [Paenibacillus oryzisoli]
MRVKKRKKSVILLMIILLFFISFTELLSEPVHAAATAEKKETYLIKLKNSSNASQWASKRGINVKRMNKTSNRSTTVVAELSPNDLKKMKADTNVSIIEKDQLVNLQSSQEVNPSNTHSIVPWGVTATQAVYAHDQGMTGNGIKIAVLDTGVFTAHPDLRIAGGQTFVEGTSTFEDDNGHGTHVAGIINASANGFGTEGTAPDAQVYVLKVLDAKGNGYYSSVIDAIEWCVDNGIQIVSMSFGGAEYSEVLHQVIQEAIAEHGILFVAAAGNNGAGGEMEKYPARYPEVVSVGSVNEAYIRSGFSSTGTELDLMAPGEQIWSTALNGEYGIRSGTSMAAPYAAGAAALVWSANKDLTAEQVRQKLLVQAVKLGHSHEYGAGFLQVLASADLSNIVPNNPGKGQLFSISRQEYEIRGLLEKLAVMQKNAMEQDKLQLAKDIDAAFNQLKIEYGILRQDSPSVTRAEYTQLSVTQSVYKLALQSIDYNSSQLETMNQLLSDYQLKTAQFQSQLEDVELPEMGITEELYWDKIGDGQTISPGETASIYFSMSTDIRNLNVEITGPDYYYTESYQVPDEHYWGFNNYNWYTENELAPGDYTIKFIGYYQQSDSTFEFYFTIHVGSTLLDEMPPVITLTPSQTTPTQQVTITVNATDNVGVTQTKWASGSQTASYFVTGGTVLSGIVFTVIANGMYTVWATDAAGNQTVQTINIDTTLPTTPTNLKLTGVTTSTISIAWTVSTDNVGVTGYDIYNGTTLIGSVNGSTATYTVTGLAANTLYNFTVKAKDTAGNISAASNTLSFFANGKLTYTYDTQGRLTSISVTSTGKIVKSFEYDNNGNLKKVTIGTP